MPHIVDDFVIPDSGPKKWYRTAVVATAQEDGLEFLQTWGAQHIQELWKGKLPNVELIGLQHFAQLVFWDSAPSFDEHPSGLVDATIYLAYFFVDEVTHGAIFAHHYIVNMIEQEPPEAPIE